MARDALKSVRCLYGFGWCFLWIEDTSNTNSASRRLGFNPFGNNDDDNTNTYTKCKWATFAFWRKKAFCARNMFGWCWFYYFFNNRMHYIASSNWFSGLFTIRALYDEYWIWLCGSINAIQYTSYKAHFRFPLREKGKFSAAFESEKANTNGFCNEFCIQAVIVADYIVTFGWG